MLRVATVILSLIISGSSAALGQVNNTELAKAPKVTVGMVHTADVDLSYEAYNLEIKRTVPIVIANGGPGFGHKVLTICPVWKTLAQTHPIVFYDQRGTGNSRLLNANASQGMPAQVQDLEALRAALGFPKINLLGHSWGGQLAMGYASTYPEHIKSLTLVDSGDPHWGTTLYLFNQLYPDKTAEDPGFDRETHQTPAEFEASLKQYFSMIFYSQEHHDAFMASISDSGANQKVNDDVSDALTGVDLTSRLKDFHFPTLVITGRFDANIAPVVAWKIHQKINGSKFVVFSKSGHMPFYEEPELFAQTINNFLEGEK
jgi:proline iminopeptidase